jgi:hypothetical protein
MNEQESVEQLEKWVTETAAAFPYPPAPDVALAVTTAVATTLRRQPAERGTTAATGDRPRRLRPVWVAVCLLAACLALLAVPQVRAGLVEWFRIGAVRIFVGEVTPTATAESALSTDLPLSDLPTQTTTPISAREIILSLAGATSLAEAQAKAAYPLLRPRYPPDLGRPDHVFHQRQPMGDTIIMLWLEPDRPHEIRLAFYQIHVPDYAIKYHSLIEETTVNDRHAIWFEGGHLLQLVDGRSAEHLFVDGNVLLWADGEVTYRLESQLSLAEVLAIAESLAPVASDR